MRRFLGRASPRGQRARSRPWTHPPPSPPTRTHPPPADAGRGCGAQRRGPPPGGCAARAGGRGKDGGARVSDRIAEVQRQPWSRVPLTFYLRKSSTCQELKLVGWVFCSLESNAGKLTDSCATGRMRGAGQSDDLHLLADVLLLRRRCA